MERKITGPVIVLGSNIDTDQIYPGRYLELVKPEEIGAHCLEGVDPEIPRTFPKGGIVVARRNFGCGSSREHAPLAIKTAGIACVIAASFARIFYRNAINIGFPILECPEAAAAIRSGDVVSVDFTAGLITDETTGQSFRANGFPPFIEQIIQSGGLLPYLKARGKD